MNQCLRCEQPYTGTTLFCEMCQDFLQTRSQQKQVADTRVLTLLPTESGEPELLPLQPVSIVRPRLIPKRLRIALIILSTLAVLALLVDIILVSIAFTRLDRTPVQRKPAPLLALTPGTVYPDQTLYTSSPTALPSPEVFAKTPTASTVGRGADSTPLPTVTATLGITITSGGTGTIGTNESTSASVSEPALELSSTSLTFSVTQGRADPASQIVTFANTGGKQLNWRMTSASASWLSVSPAKGSLAAQQTVQIIVNSNAIDQLPGTYQASVTVVATDSTGKMLGGGPESLLVRLIVLQPCSLQVNPTSLSFTASLLQPTPPAKSITVQMVGNCLRPVSWVATVDSDSSKWLALSATSGKNDGTIAVQVNAKGMLLKSTQGYITISATDQSGDALQNSSQTVTVSLLVL